MVRVRARVRARVRVRVRLWVRVRVRVRVLGVVAPVPGEAGAVDELVAAQRVLLQHRRLALGEAVRAVGGHQRVLELELHRTWWGLGSG